MSAVQHEFFTRYATSPIHVPRLERLLAAYARSSNPDQFAQTYLDWDRACGDPEAARVVTELLAVLVDDQGAIVRFKIDAVKGAIEWLSAAPFDERQERVQLLRAILSEAIPKAE